MSPHNRIAVSRLLLAATILASVGCSNDHLPQPQPGAQTQNDDMTPSVAPPQAVTPSAVAPEESALSQLKADKPVSSCHIDSLSAAGASASPGAPFQIAKGSNLSVAGWVASPDEDAVPAEVTMRMLLDGDSGKVWQFKTATGGNRSDVAAYKGKPALAKSGFAFTADLSQLSAGTYHVYVAFEHQGQAFSCNGGDTIVIGQ